jgi:hypothetical protein
MGTEGMELEYSEDSIREIARVAYEVCLFLLSSVPGTCGVSLSCTSAQHHTSNPGTIRVDSSTPGLI